MLVIAMRLRVGDILADGKAIKALTREGGLVRAHLEDGRKMVVPEHHLVSVKDRPKRPLNPPLRIVKDEERLI